MTMNFIEMIANYKLGNFSWSHFPEIAMAALNEGFESDSLFILAGMNKNENTFELEQYFKSSLAELHISLPEFHTAAKILLKYYLNEMVIHEENAYNIVTIIDNNIYRQVNWEEELNLPKKQFIGEELGLEKIFTWYRELQDFYDGGMLLYYNDLSEKEQKKKIEEHLIKEAKVLLEKLRNN
jgi:hypothetical protein